MGQGIGKQLAKAALNKSVGALQRLDAVEKAQQQILLAVRQTFGLIDARLGGQQSSLNALITLFGRDTVEQEIVRQKVEELEGTAVKEKAGFDQAVEEGKLVKADIVGPRTVIVGHEVDGDGRDLHPLRVQMLFGMLKPEFQPAYKDHRVGDVIETPINTKFTINELWDVVPPSSVNAAAAESAAATALVAPPTPADPTAEPEVTAADEAVPADDPVDASTEAELLADLAGTNEKPSQSN
jgi:hypothetical protein